MKNVLKYLLHPLTLVGVAFLSLAGLLWWLGPVFSWNDNHPLDGAFARGVAIGVLALVFGLGFGLRQWRRRRTNARLVKGMAGGASAADREVQALHKRFEEALQVMEDSARQSGKKSFLHRTQYLYEKPWYVFIGAPGSGKTTALLNAGLTFPLAAKMGQASVKGVGGTRNCDWWFTEDAVLIDTAGRYTLQQSDQTADAAAWNEFLAQLRRSRPQRPLNGVMLTLSVQDLLQQPPAERKEHAAKLRQRMQELHEQLGVRPPVYVLVTKADLIAGFNETFGNLGKEERDQVWGVTFPYDRSGGRDSVLQSFGNEFAALEKRLRDRLLAGMETETDPLKRAAMFAFPQQFSGLKGLLGGFLEQVFEGGGGLEERPLLRGVYFTSGTQEGSPIDRVLGTLARTFGVDGRAAGIAAARGKSFFLTRLLRDVVFAEQGLAGENEAVAQATRVRRRAGLGVLALASLLLLAGWGVSWWRNKAYIDEVAARLPDVKAAVDGLPPTTSASVAPLGQVFDKVLAAPVPSAFSLDDPPLLNGLGLYQGRVLAAGAKIGYDKLLDHALMPRVVQRLEERLRAVNRDNLELAYESLKAYLMVYQPDHFDGEAFKAWVTLDWDANLSGTLTPEQREALGKHLDAALAAGAPPIAVPMDKTLVANVREMLIAYPLEYRVFSRVKRAGVGSDIPAFTAAAAAGPNAPRVFERASGAPLTQGIPGLFTRDGYYKAFKGAQAKVMKQLADEEKWVLGTDSTGKSAMPAQAARELDERIKRLYLGEYIKVWDAYLADVRMIKLAGLDTSLAVAGLLAAPDSPLVSYLRAVARETALGASAPKPGAEAAAAEAATKKLQKLGRAKDELTAIVGAPTADNSGPGGQPIEFIVDEHFANIQRMVTGTPPPVDEVTKLFGQVLTQLTAIDAAQKSKTAPPPAGGSAAVKAAAGTQPEPIKSMLEGLVEAGDGQSRTAERQGLSAELKPITEACNKTIAGRYPIAQGAKADILPDDFGQMFGAGGLLDDFYARRLATLVDTGATPWAYRPLPDGTRPAGGGAALADFQRASKIRDAFFRGGGKAPAFKVEMRLLEMDPALKELTLDIDGTAIKFTPGNTVAQVLTWPSTRVASQLKFSAAGGGAPVQFEGPWALFRFIGSFEAQPSPQPERFTLVMTIDGRKARMEVISASALNPLRLPELRTFRCPESL